MVDESGSVLIMDTLIKDVLRYTEDIENYCFVNRWLYIHQIPDMLGGNRNMEALLITHSGNKNEKLLGIITVWDLVSITNELSSRYMIMEKIARN